MDKDDELKKAYHLWTSFKEEILYKNRFIVKHEVLDYLKHFVEKNQKIIEKDEILYRARLYTGDDSFIQYLKSDFNFEGLDNYGQIRMSMNKAYISLRQNSGFWGYNEKESFVPTINDMVNDGRANPAFINYLYTSEEPYTALVEVRPYLNSQVSVAKINVIESLSVADFSYESLGKFDGVERKLMILIMFDFSRPSDSDKKSYIPTQYVAEFIKTLGMEGIRFNSSLHGRGRNITIFNYEKCQPIGSKLYNIKDICFEAEGIAPLYEEELIHEKLKPYKIKQFEDFLHNIELKKLKKEKEE